jgi:hypothetical protein
MAGYADPPFNRGSSLQDGLATVDSTAGANYEGMEYEFEDVNPSTGVVRSGRKVRVRCVRNSSGFAILPKRLCKFALTAGKYGRIVTGYCTTVGEESYPADEYLPSTGVADGDLFYIVVEGPALVKTDLAAGANNVFNVGDKITALTAVTSNATTSGRVQPQDLTGATALLANQIQNRIGYALSAKTTANTNDDLLVDVGHW